MVSSCDHLVPTRNEDSGRQATIEIFQSVEVAVENANLQSVRIIAGDGHEEIVFAFHDGSILEFWSASPENNWVYMVEKRRGREVEVKFFNTRTENEAKFKADVNDGRVKISKES